MSQHDMNIANQGFPAFRADLNDALGALVSNSSGTTAPATTFAHQFWVDTSANPSILKIRNADNDAWVTIGSINQTDDKFKLTPADGVSTDTISELTSAAGVTVDGVLLKDSGVVTGAGTVSAPVYSTTGDLNTGIYFPAADNIGFATGGTIRGRWTTDGLCFGSDTAAANALDDYEEGSWTPAADRGTTSPTITYDYRTGRYTKIGRLVYAQFDLTITSISANGSGSNIISGLPYTALAGANDGGFAIALWRDSSAVPVGPTATTTIKGFVSSTNISIQYDNTGSAGSGTNASVNGNYSTSRIQGMVIYQVA